MNPLTADEMECVAREVTGKPYKAHEKPGIGEFGSVSWGDYDTDGIFIDRHFWSPESDGDNWRQLVEWLADRLKEMKMQTPPDFYGYNTIACRMEEAIWSRDTTALQRMVLELRNPQ